MITPNEFWLALHSLSEAYLAEGVTPDERGANILAQFRRMPPSVRQSVLADMQHLVANLDDLFASAQAVAQGDEPARAVSRAG
jgi:hypothetical protein